MNWSSIAFDGGLLSSDCIWARTVFQHLYEAAADAEYDELALYVAKTPGHPVIFYLSPRATDRFNAADAHLHLTACERPDTENVELLLGHPLAWHTEWCELTFAERRAWDGAVRAEDHELVEELGMGQMSPGVA
jgi:hypothetical protein